MRRGVEESRLPNEKPDEKGPEYDAECAHWMALHLRRLPSRLLTALPSPKPSVIAMGHRTAGCPHTGRALGEGVGRATRSTARRTAARSSGGSGTQPSPDGSETSSRTVDPESP